MKCNFVHGCTEDADAILLWTLRAEDRVYEGFFCSKHLRKWCDTLQWAAGEYLVSEAP